MKISRGPDGSTLCPLATGAAMSDTSSKMKNVMPLTSARSYGRRRSLRTCRWR